MKCAVRSCNNSFKLTPNVTFHRFPTDPQILEVWISATGKPNFVPKDISKICSNHFVESDYIRPKWLKADAIPSTNLETCQEMTSKDDISTKECSDVITTTSNPLSTILDKQIQMNKIQIIKQNSSGNVPLTTCLSTAVVSSPQLSQIVNVVPNGNVFLNFNQSFTTNPIQLNTMPLSVPVSLVQVQGMGGHQTQLVAMQSASTIINPLQSTAAIKQTSSLIVSKQYSIAGKPINECSDNTLGGIKVVDVKKLLQPALKEGEGKTSLNVTKVSESNSEKEGKLLKSAVVEELLDSSKITVSHVLKCLKEILPDNFDLSRLIPNEKVSKLIIRYLKLTDCVNIDTVVKSHLEIIVKASKSKAKVNGDINKHPYMNIKPLALQVALAKLLPPNYTMVDVTDSLLNCLCVILKKDIYFDGYPILRGKIFNFSKDNIDCHDNVDKEKSASSPNSFDENEISVIDDSRHGVFINEHPSLSTSFEEDNKDTIDMQIAKEVSSPKENSSNSKRYRKVTFKRKSYYVGTDDDDDPDYSPHEDVPNDTVKSTTISEDNSSLPNHFFRSILNYLQIKQCSAQDVLINFKLMFQLCRYLNLKSKQSNLVKLKAILRLIVGQNMNLGNVERFEKQTFKGKHLPDRMNLLGGIDKLRMNPVVVLTDLVASTKAPLTGLSSNKKSQPVVKPKSPNPHRKYNESFSQSLKQIQVKLKYSSDHVRKETDESYKMFRKIIKKKDNNKVYFCLKYKDLPPGTKVYVKDVFYRRSFGYLQGTVIERSGPISYVVKLESTEKRNCYVDHLRPVFGFLYSTRTQRLIKPKQLFDL